MIERQRRRRGLDSGHSPIYSFSTKTQAKNTPRRLQLGMRDLLDVDEDTWARWSASEASGRVSDGEEGTHRATRRLEGWMNHAREIDGVPSMRSREIRDAKQKEESQYLIGRLNQSEVQPR